jgi:hypothetical protein
MNYEQSKEQQLRRACNYESYSIYNPQYDRRYPEWGCQYNIAVRDIDIDEEILDNYICYGGTDFFLDVIDELQQVCGGGIGFVTQYETTIKTTNSD